MKRVMLFVLFAAFFALPIFSQDVPDSWQDLYDNYAAFFGTYLGIAGVAMFLGEYVIRLLKLTVKFQKVVVVVLLSIGISFLASVINIGYLAESVWYETLLWGALSAAAAAGLRSTNLLFAKTIVDFIIGLIAQKEPSN